ncbi:NUDIX hydrolase [Jeotgalibacillus proteolyticus]|uniref:DNA mismatch repair protein MutT n=1 Tax=Jeotgalibacillus proteolyticus TaxID=2082395 RepID=A0A2S5GBR5_9BACL|nr:NUDIX domain-containing protein [Jeotgalibacillus proteolyticus]PPA70354.1 DNA mismatch repair protein MutT [Jeotgalibacillus proteolyticus]
MFIVNVEGAVHKDGKWLMVIRSEKEEHAGGELAMVGGKVDQEGFSSDILERTLAREMKEEVGIEIQNLRYVNSSTFVTDAGAHVVDIVFVCDHLSGEAYAVDKDEVSEVVWLTTEQIVEDTSLPDYLRENIRLAAAVLNGKS